MNPSGEITAARKPLICFVRARCGKLQRKITAFLILHQMFFDIFSHYSRGNLLSYGANKLPSLIV